MIIIEQPNVSFSPEHVWHEFLTEMLKVKYKLEDEEDPDKGDIDEVDRVIEVAKRVIKRFDDEKTAADSLDKPGYLSSDTMTPALESKKKAPRFGRDDQ